MRRAVSFAILVAATAGLAAIAEADPPQDPHGIVTIQVENDAVSTRSGTSDEYYTAGQRIGFTTGTQSVPAFLDSFGHLVWGGGGVQRVSLNLSQTIFTPYNTQLDPPDPRDRPYAGWLRGEAQLLTDTDNSRSVLGVSLGVIGPAALGEEVQNGFHSLIGDTTNKGWGYQLPNEPAIQVMAGRTYRLPIAQFAGLETDALPGAEIDVGSVRDYVQAGAVFRIGQGLSSDFGVARISPGFSGGDAYTPVRQFGWYLFAGGDGQAVARDEFLDGSAFRSSPSVGHRALVGEAEAGVGLMFAGARLTYVQTWQSPEFGRQRAGVFNFGSLALSVRF